MAKWTKSCGAFGQLVRQIMPSQKALILLCARSITQGVGITPSNDNLAALELLSRGSSLIIVHSPDIIEEERTKK